MNWSDSETEIYNKAMAKVEATNKALARVYLKTQKEIADKLKQFFLSVDPSWSKQYQAQRLSEIFKEINTRLTVLTKITTKQMEEAYLSTYTDVFKSYSYNLGEYVGILPLSIASEKLILQGLADPIGNYNFKQFQGYTRETLISDLKEQVGISLLKNEGPVKLAKRLESIFGDSIARISSTARTELLKSFSLAQEESVRQAEEQGISFKFRWLGRNDGRERESHIALNGTYAHLEKDGKYYFYAGGCKGTSPRLFKGPKQGAQNIQCRCRRINEPQTK
jgi:hypothetical protein